MTNSPSARPIVLVPGFWLGAWAWEQVEQRLADRGLRAHSITLPGLESASTDRTRIRFGDHVAAVTAAIVALDEPVVLVAHSGAGAVVTAGLEAHADRVSRVVY